MKSEKERGKKEEKIIVVMASRRWAMKELGRERETTSSGGSPRVSHRGPTKREREFYLMLSMRTKRTLSEKK